MGEGYGENGGGEGEGVAMEGVSLSGGGGPTIDGGVEPNYCTTRIFGPNSGLPFVRSPRTWITVDPWRRRLKLALEELLSL